MSVTGRADLARLLVACATTDGGAAPGVRLSPDLDPARLLRALSRHGLTSSAHVALCDVELPAGLRVSLCQQYRVMAERHALAALELARLGHLLDGAGIRWAVAKGPVLAHTVYPRPDLRTYADLDILVARRDFGRVVDTLTQAGGGIVESDWKEVLHLFKGELNIGFPFTTIDLHWSLLYDEELRRQFRWDDSYYLEGTVRADLGNQLTVPTLSPVATLLHVSTHAALAGGQRLSWLRDIQLAAGRPHLDWDEFVIVARRQGTALGVGAMMRRTRHSLGTVPWPIDVELSLMGRSTWAGLLGGMDRLHPPERWTGGSFSGHLVMASTRSDGRASIGAFGRRASSELSVIRTDANHPWHERLPRVFRAKRPPVSDHQVDQHAFRSAYVQAVGAPDQVRTSGLDR